MNSKDLTNAIIQLQDGSVSIPSLKFGNGGGLGLYKKNVNTLSAVSGGSEVFNISPNGILSSSVLSLPTGNVTTPSLNFGDVTTGIYSGGLNNLSVTVAGVNRAQFTSGALTLTNDTTIVGSTFADNITVSSGKVLSLPTGNAGAPVINFGDTDTGIYTTGAGNVSISTNGNQRISITDTTTSINNSLTISGLTSTAGATLSSGVLTLPVGSVSTPSINFGDLDTGLYATGAGSVALSTNGSQRVAVSDASTNISNNLTVTGSTTTGGATLSSGVLTLPAGSIGSPSVNFGDADTGLYSTGAGNVAVTTNGIQRVAVSDDITNITNNLTLPLGSNLSPSLYFGDVDTGIYSTGVNNVSVTTNGVKKISIDNSIVTVSGSSLSIPYGYEFAPSLNFGDVDTGFYSINPQDLSFSIKGNNKMSISVNSIQINTAVNSTGSITGSNGLYITAGTSEILGGLRVKQGSLISPGINFGDADTGLYSTGAGNVAVTTNGVQRVSVTDTTTTITNSLVTAGATLSSGVLALPVGSAVVPSVNFSDADTGFYSTGVGNVAVTTNGVQRVSVSDTTTNINNNLTVTGVTTTGGATLSSGVLSLPGGNISNPSINFGDTDTGIYSTGAGNVAVTTNGVQRLSVSDANATLTTSLTVAGATLSSGVLTLPVGSASNPSINFGDVDTGIYSTVAGNVSLTTNSVQRVSVNDANTTVSNNLIVSEVLTLPIGSIGVPTLNFGDADTGLYSTGAGNVAVTTNGVQRVSVTDATTTITNNTVINGKLQVPTGTAADPSIAFGNTAAGIYSTTTGTISVATNAGERINVTDAKTTIRNDLNVTGLTTTAGATLSSGVLTLPAGTAFVPSANFGDTSTGFYRNALNNIAVTTAGIQRLSISTTAIISTLPLTLPVGSAASTSLNFGTAGTGFFQSALNKIGIAINGSEKITISETSITNLLTNGMAAGTVSAPSLYFGADTTTGFYRYAVNEIGLAIAGVLSARYQASGTTTQYALGGSSCKTIYSNAANTQTLTVGCNGTNDAIILGTQPEDGIISVSNAAKSLHIAVGGTSQLDISNSSTAVNNDLVVGSVASVGSAGTNIKGIFADVRNVTLNNSSTGTATITHNFNITGTQVISITGDTTRGASTIFRLLNSSVTANQFSITWSGSASSGATPIMFTIMVI